MNFVSHTLFALVSYPLQVSGITLQKIQTHFQPTVFPLTLKQIPIRGYFGISSRLFLKLPHGHSINGLPFKKFKPISSPLLECYFGSSQFTYTKQPLMYIFPFVIVFGVRTVKSNKGPYGHGKFGVSKKKSATLPWPQSNHFARALCFKLRLNPH